MRALQHEIPQLPRIIMLPLLPQPPIMVRTPNLLQHALPRLELRRQPRDRRHVRRLRVRAFAQEPGIAVGVGAVVRALLGRADVAVGERLGAGFPVPGEVEAGDAPAVFLGRDVVVSA